MFSTSTEDIVLVAVVRRALFRSKEKLFIKKKLDEFDEASRLFQLVSIENCDDLVSKNVIREVSAKISTFVAASIKLRIVLRLLQETNLLAQRVRFLATKSASMRLRFDRMSDDKSDFEMNFEEDAISENDVNVENKISRSRDEVKKHSQS